LTEIRILNIHRDRYTFLLNKCIWVDNIKMDIRGTSFVFIFNYALQQGQRGILGKVIEFILQKIYKYLQGGCN
jgi:hypothetical protein